MTRFTPFNFELQHEGQQRRLIQTDKSSVLPHPVHTAVPWSVIEACSGIGAVDVGYQFCGIQPSCYIEQNPKYCEWLQAHGNDNVIQGDITDEQVVQKVALQVRGKHVLSAGVSCQPFSKLGDMRAQADDRSRSFTGALQLGHCLQSMIIILECTPYVKECEWAQAKLQLFASQTGYTICQNVLHLNKMWPAFRSRWWTILAHPSLGNFHIPDLPELEFGPSILAVMPQMLPMPSSQCEELELDRYELRQFHAYKAGISSFVINKCKALPTATHSWGSQAKPCLCGCRPTGFSTERLMEKGLHGVLHSLDGFVKSGSDTFHTMRHLHPQEVALLNGLPPEFITPTEAFPLRLELSAVGQMGSPLQSCWVLANILFQMATKGLLSDAHHPRQIMWKVCQNVLQSRDRVWKSESKTIYQRIFEKELETIHRPMVRVRLQDEESFTQKIREVIPSIEAELAKQTLKKCELGHLVGKGKGGTLLKQNGEHQPKHEPGSKNAVTVERVEDNAAAFPIVECRTTKSAEAQESDCRAGQERNQAIRAFKSQVAEKPEQHEHDVLVHGSQPLCDPKQVEVFHSNGGVPGFETSKRKHDEGENEPSKRPKAKWDEISPTLQWTEPAAESKSVVHAAESEVVWVGTHREAFVPIRFHQQHVGQICAAEAKLTGNPIHEIRCVDSMGLTLSQNKQLQPGMAITIQQANEWINDKCPMNSDCQPPNVSGLSRIDALRHQKGWVALDEMEFYLENLATTKGVNISKPLKLHETPGAEFVLEDWLDKNMELANVSNGYLKVYTAGIQNNHWFPIVLDTKEDHFEVHSTPHGQIVLEKMIQAVFGVDETQCKMQSMVIGESFPADCGFQTYSWLMAHAEGKDSCTPMSTQEAIGHREQFAEALVQSNRHQSVVHQLTLGGMQDAKTKTDLQRLLE